MDRRSWLWRRKSSDKSPSGETESSGSVSSHSERFSDDQTLSSHNIQSPEVTSKASPPSGELNDSVKILSEKLSEALDNIRAKEDAVKQHAKVAEEAVSGWEKAESEVSILKKQNDALTQRNLILEERVGHLDGALKECLRQLRQAREEQEEKILESLTKKSSEWESNKSEFEHHLADVRSKLEALERENSILKLMLEERAEELKVISRERDLSTRAAESASKQHLDSIRRVAKLEAECHRLKAVARKATAVSDHRPVTLSSVYGESFTDSLSENGDRALVIETDSCKSEPCQRDSWPSPLGRCLIVPSAEIDLMDDFLEMEKLAALPQTDSGNNSGVRNDGGETILSEEMEAMIKRTGELEEELRKITEEKVSLEIALKECRIHLITSENQLSQTEDKLVDLKSQLDLADEATRFAEKEVEGTRLKLENSTKILDDTKLNFARIQDRLVEANEAKSLVEVKLVDANIKKEEAELQLKSMELVLESLHSSISNLEREVERERKASREAVVKCDLLEVEISKMKLDSQFQRTAIIDEFRIDQDKELAVAATKFAECQKTIASLGHQLKSLAALEDFLIDSERPASVI